MSSRPTQAEVTGGTEDDREEDKPAGWLLPIMVERPFLPCPSPTIDLLTIDGTSWTQRFHGSETTLRGTVVRIDSPVVLAYITGELRSPRRDIATLTVTLVPRRKGNRFRTVVGLTFHPGVGRYATFRMVAALIAIKLDCLGSAVPKSQSRPTTTQETTS